MKFRLSAPSLVFASLAALAGGLLTSCLQDPGQTGLVYLRNQGVKLSAPLYHLSLDDLPLDSVFASELPLDHFGETLLVVGRESQYIAKARLGFQITTPTQHRQLDTGLFLRLVPLPMFNSLIGREFLYASTRDRDSLTVVVESFSWVDSVGKFNDSLNYFHNQILRSRVPFSILAPQYRRLDTLRLSPKAAFDTTMWDTTQAGALPNLQARLRSADSTRKWAVYLEISPLPNGNDSGMFRFLSQVTGNAATIRSHGSGLWLGRYQEDSIPQLGTLVAPYRTGNYGLQPAANYEVLHTGPSNQSLLYGVSRGVHFRLNRDTLLARIKIALGPDSNLLGPTTTPTGRLDRRFYVPYAEIRLPLRDSLNRVDGSFAFDVQLLSDVDSLADGDSLGNVGVSLDDSIALPFTGAPAYSSISRDSLKVSYRPHPRDSTLRHIILTWVKDPDATDTFTVVPDGNHREMTSTRRTGWLHQTNLSVVPSPSRLSIGVYFSANSISEPSNIRDSTGKRDVTLFQDMKRRFVRPGADSLTVRATRGLGTLLNRTSAASIAPDLYLRSVERSVFDTLTVNGASYNKVLFPVMGEVGFPRDANGKVRMGLEIYLYPLEGGQ